MKATRFLNKTKELGGNNNDDERDSDSLDPDEVNEGLQMIADSVIGEEYLRRITNQNDLTKVDYLQIQVNVNSQSVFGIEDHLPNLSSLVLDDSVISSVRDLGTGFSSLISLSINSCALNDLDGINALANLKDLSACDNFITDAACLTTHENIETLKLSGNNISSISVADELNSCPKLSSLFLSRNPVEKSPEYRLVITSLISGLEKLDGVPVDRNAAARVTNSMLLEAADALKLAEEEADDEERLMMDMQLDLEAEIAGADGQIIRPVHAGDGGVVESPRGGKGSPRMGSLPDTGSELTHGSTVVLAGSMAAAMRRRNRPGSGEGLSVASSKGGGEGAHTTRMEGAASTLEVLDSALQYDKTKRNDSGSAGAPSSIQFVKEGDVTTALYPEHADSPRMRRHSSKPHGGGDIYASFDPEAGSLSSYDGGAVEEMVLGEGSSNRSSWDGRSGDGLSQHSRGRPLSAAPVRGGQWVGGGGSVSARPGTAADATSPSKSRANARNTPSAVFKIAADEGDLVKFKSKINVRSKAAEDVADKTPVWDVDRTSTGHRAEKVVTGSGEEEEEEEEYHSRQDGSSSRSAQALQLERARLGPKKSYIHQDMVIRGNETHVDDEDIAVSAQARHELADASRAVRGLQGKSSGAGAKIDSKTGSGADISDFKGDPLARGATGIFPTKGAASMAGMSLGFNLKESLAAIDQWVEEMGSDDESTSRDGLDGEDDDSVEDLDLHNLSHKSLITSYADITPDKASSATTPRTVETDRHGHITSTPGEVGGGPVAGDNNGGGYGGHNNNRPSSKGSSRSGSRGSSRAGDSFAPEGTGSCRILSRDVIISMCHGGERLTERDSSSENLPAEAEGGGGRGAAPQYPVPGRDLRREEDGGVPTKKGKDVLPSASLGLSSVGEGQGSSPPRVEDSEQDVPSDGALGPALSMTDVELVTMLRMKPKAVPALRTRSAYCNFFNGISKSRMKSLLEKAYEEVEDEEEKKAKVEKRIVILDGFLA